MRKLIIIVLLALFYMPSFAQLDSFKLSDFILPDYRRHSLDVRFNLDAKNNYSKNTDQDDRFVNNLTNTFSLGYSLNKFTRKNEQSINESSLKRF